ncbi:ATP-binding protein [Brooklawnia sp.]|uniref:sensor histidine kinase n=1 Tax=Brooklawnia sp. TaxID=2699740 RepID=UPI00311EA706
MSSEQILPGDPSLLRTIYRAAGWARIALVVHMIVVNGMRASQVRQPGLLMLACLVAAGWSVAACFLNLRSRWRTRWLMLLDMAITLAVVGSSRLVLGVDLLRESYLGLACYWMLAAPAVLAIWRGPLAGLIGGVLVGSVQFLQAPSLAPRAWGDVLLMAAIPTFIGLVVRQLSSAIADRDRNLATVAALEERERLNRIVHDGVLQVLAMVAREGAELGPRGQLLASLALRQEDQLRATLQDRRVDIQGGGFLDVNTTDVTIMLEKHQSDTVTVATMAGQLNMADARAKELDRVISEVLANVSKHAGPGAHAWILLEQEGNELIISVRDDGVGVTQEQLDAAAAAGRLGVKESVIGRVIDLGGTSTLTTSPGSGTEWEFRMPLE